MASWQFASDQTNPFLDELSPPPDPWGAHNVWGGGELVHNWDHAASPSTVDHILCSGSTCVLCRRECSGFPPVETSPCSPLALIMLTDCTATLCSFAMQHVVPSEGLVVPETPLPALLPVWQSSRLQLCLTIQYCSASPSENIVQSEHVLCNTILSTWCNLLNGWVRGTEIKGKRKE